MVKTILLTTDGSENSRHAIDQARELGVALDAEIRILTVSPDAGEMQQDQLRADPAEDAEATIEEATQAFEGSGLAVTSSVRTGLPDEQILEYVDENDIDMIVMGTHGRTGLKRVVIGSIAEKTVRNSPVPVLTVPPR